MKTNCSNISSFCESLESTNDCEKVCEEQRSNCAIHLWIVGNEAFGEENVAETSVEYALKTWRLFDLLRVILTGTVTMFEAPKMALIAQYTCVKRSTTIQHLNLNGSIKPTIAGDLLLCRYTHNYEGVSNDCHTSHDGQNRLKYSLMNRYRYERLT